MPSQQPLEGRSAEDDLSEYEYIDLTKSPEPSPSPRSQQHPQHHPPPRQQHLARRFTSGPSNMQPSEPGHAGTVPPTIHIDQLRRIIDTSDQRSVRTVLLNLCKLSPALSGAVARGLAPQSSYAQHTIRAYRNKKAASGSRPGADQHVQTASESAKKASGTTPREIITLSDDEEDLADFKFEWDDESQTAPTGSSSASGWTSKAAPIKSESPHANFTNLPVRPAAHSARFTPVRETTVFTNPPVVKSETKVKTEPNSKQCVMTCRNCDRVIQDRAEPCLYHPGHKTVVTTNDSRRESVYACCKRPIHKAGCCTGTHDVVTALRSPSGFARDPKKPRLV